MAVNNQAISDPIPPTGPSGPKNGRRATASERILLAAIREVTVVCSSSAASGAI